MYIDVSFPRPSSSPRLGILVHWLPIDSVLLTKPLQRALRRPNKGRKYNSNTLKNGNNRTKRLALLGGCFSR